MEDGCGFWEVRQMGVANHLASNTITVHSRQGHIQPYGELGEYNVMQTTPPPQHTSYMMSVSASIHGRMEQKHSLGGWNGNTNMACALHMHT